MNAGDAAVGMAHGGVVEVYPGTLVVMTMPLEAGRHTIKFRLCLAVLTLWITVKSFAFNAIRIHLLMVADTSAGAGLPAPN